MWSAWRDNCGNVVPTLLHDFMQNILQGTVSFKYISVAGRLTTRFKNPNLSGRELAGFYDNATCVYFLPERQLDHGVLHQNRKLKLRHGKQSQTISLHILWAKSQQTDDKSSERNEIRMRSAIEWMTV
jgi:hypothetical protein